MTKQAEPTTTPKAQFKNNTPLAVIAINIYVLAVFAMNLQTKYNTVVGIQVLDMVFYAGVLNTL